MTDTDLLIQNLRRENEALRAELEWKQKEIELARLSSGVTVQEWISVDDRQPNNKGCYLLTVKHWFDGEPVVREACWNGKDWFSCDDRRYKITPRVTHWMPLPSTEGLK